MNKFQQMVAANASTIKQSRANALANQASRAQQNLLNDLLNKKEDIQAEIESLTDLAPTDLNSLKPGIDSNFSVDNWVTELHVKNCELYQIDIEIEIAKKNLQEWFTDEDTKKGKPAIED